MIVAGIALTAIGLMPGNTYERGLPLAVVLVGFALVLLVNFLRYLRERYVNAKQLDWEDYEWKSPQERRQDLRWRRSTRARSRSGSRVLSLGSSANPGRPKIQNSSARRQDELRAEQGRAYTRDAQRRGRFISEAVNAHSAERSRRSGTDDVQRDSLTNLTSLLGMTPADVEQVDVEQNCRPPIRSSQQTQLTEAAAQRQEKLRIEHGKQYAREANFSAKVRNETISERRKRARLRRRRDKFWRQTRSFWM